MHPEFLFFIMTGVKYLKLFLRHCELCEKCCQGIDSKRLICRSRVTVILPVHL
jgi:hypothetical protein